MGLFKKYVNQTKKPEGTLGKMNGNAAALSVTPLADGASLVSAHLMIMQVQ